MNLQGFSEKLSVGSTLLMVVVLGVVACMISLGFGKLQVENKIKHYELKLNKSI